MQRSAHPENKRVLIMSVILEARSDVVSSLDSVMPTSCKC